jgi:gliding motility-associated-like protein
VIELEIYNVFTPTPKDGKNDVFDIKIQGQKLYDLVIYNRWGQQVFQTNNADSGWDGLFENELAPVGIYAYRFKYSLGSGVSGAKKGSFLLFR